MTTPTLHTRWPDPAWRPADPATHHPWSVRTLADRLSRDRLARHGYLIAASSLVTSALGFVFWAVAARRFSATDVGLAASLVAVLGVVGTVAQGGMVNALNRYLPTAGPGARPLLVRAGLVATAAGTAGGLLVAQLGRVGLVSSVTVLTDHAFGLVLLPALCGLWALFVVQDGALAGLHRPRLMLASNAAHASAKLLALVLLPVGVAVAPFWAWTITLPPIVAWVWWRMLRIAPSGPAPAERIGLVRFAAADHVATLSLTVATTALPIILVDLQGAASTARFSVAWSTAYVAYLLGRGMAMSLLSETAASPGRADDLWRAATWRALLVQGPLVAVLVLGAVPVLGIFGPSYTAAAPLLQLLAVATLPGMVISGGTAVLRATGAYRLLMGVTVGSTVVLVGGLGPATAVAGLTGVGWLWLGVNLLGAAALVAVRRPGWVAPWIGSAREHVRQQRGRRAVRRTVLPQDLSTPGGPQVELSTGDGVRTVRIGPSADDGRHAVVRTALGPSARHGLMVAAQAQRRARLLGLDGLVMVPRVLQVVQQDGLTVAVEDVVPGVPAAALVSEGVLSRRQATEVVARGLDHLHRADPRGVRIAPGPTLGRPAARALRAVLMADGRRAAASSLERLVAPTLARMERVHMAPAVTHGDPWLGNALLDRDRLAEVRPGSPWWRGQPLPGRPAPMALVDWEAAATAGSPVQDLAVLLLTSRAAGAAEELGVHVAALLAERDLDGWERQLLVGQPVDLSAWDDPTPGLLGLRDIVLLGWLSHLATNVAKSGQYRPGTLWFARNADPVLSC